MMGSIDVKARIWGLSEQRVVAWTDAHDSISASYQHNGNVIFFSVLLCFGDYKVRSFALFLKSQLCSVFLYSLLIFYASEKARYLSSY